MPDDDSGWLDADDLSGLWEYQLQSLTVGDLRAALASLPEDAAVEVTHYDGSHFRALRVMHIDAKTLSGHSIAVVVTVH